MAARDEELERKQGSLDALRAQLKEVKNLNMQMLSNLQDAQGKVKGAEHSKRKAEEGQQAAEAARLELESKLAESSAKKKELEATMLELTARLGELDTTGARLEEELAAEKRARGGAEAELDASRARADQLETDLVEAMTWEERFQELQESYDTLQGTNTELESALVEMGSHLSEEKLAMTEIERKQKETKQRGWEQSKEATHCKRCSKKFTVTIRKHHCRNCGGVFCNDCTDNKMPLPATPKPVRVCDPCYRELLSAATAGD